MDFSRQSVPKKSNADLNEIIDKAINVIENQLSLNKVKIIKQAEPNLPNLIVDANQIQQVFINLFVNASDAMGKSGGTININSQRISLSPYGSTAD